MIFLKHSQFWLTLISIILSLYAAISTWRYEHMKLKISLNWIYDVGGQYDVCFSLFNPSSRPKVITNISLNHENKKFKATTYPSLLIGEKGYSNEFPVNINPFSAKYAIVPFKFVNLSIDDTLREFTFEINSKEVTKKFNLHSKEIDANEFDRIMSIKNSSVSQDDA